MKGNKYVRKIEDAAVFDYWCDYCRTYTDDPEQHKHEDPIY